jgi:nitrite reductase/ring-hydroxylating ferredoxin subunit
LNAAATFDLGPVADLVPFRPALRRAGDLRLAVVRLADAADGVPVVRVFDDACPHAADPLSGGFCAEDRLYCRAHGWAFSLHDGACVAGERTARLPVHRAAVVEGRVVVSL